MTSSSFLSYPEKILFLFIFAVLQLKNIFRGTSVFSFVCMLFLTYYCRIEKFNQWRYHHASSNKETVPQDFIEFLKHSLQNFYKILRESFLCVALVYKWWTHSCMDRIIISNKHSWNYNRFISESLEMLLSLILLVLWYC